MSSTSHTSYHSSMSMWPFGTQSGNRCFGSPGLSPSRFFLQTTTCSFGFSDPFLHQRSTSPLLPITHQFLRRFERRRYTLSRFSSRFISRSEEHTSELQSLTNLVC